ncbi:MAG: preprotein translocase subunit SecE [Myxococcota bacterium]|nr:preprotein translocase subunit SecE [Myxococcota bacterium]
MATKEVPKTEHEVQGEADQSVGVMPLVASPEDQERQTLDLSSELDREAVEANPPVEAPTQLGTGRFVYAAYFAGAIGIAFLASKITTFVWAKLQGWKPAVGEPLDEIVMPLSALVGALTAVYFWRRTRVRALAEEVATEMSKVTWPTRTEVTNGTFVVIVTTVVSTIFFALMDKFWGFVTNLVYGST